MAAGCSQRLPHRRHALKHQLTALIIALIWSGSAWAFNDAYRRDVLDSNVLRIDEGRHLGTTIPDITVTTQTGSQPLSSLMAEMPTVLVLSYYTCGHTCPVLIKNLSVLPIDTPRSDYRVVVLSFDENDSLETMAHLKAGLGTVPANWTIGILSGSESKRLTEAVGFRFFFSERDQTFVHPTVLVLLSPQREVMRYLYGAEPRQGDVELALIESRNRAPRLNDIVDMFKLTCYHFDGSKSRYVLHPSIIFGSVGLGVLGIAGLAALASKKHSRGDV